MGTQNMRRVCRDNYTQEEGEKNEERKRHAKACLPTRRPARS